MSAIALFPGPRLPGRLLLREMNTFIAVLK